MAARLRLQLIWLSGTSGFSAPTKALANSVKPIASGAQLPCPGLATAAAYTTDTSVNVMISCRAREPHSSALVDTNCHQFTCASISIRHAWSGLSSELADDWAWYTRAERLTGSCCIAQLRQVNEMWPTSQPNSWPLVTAGSCVGVKHPGPPSPWPTRTPGMIIACPAVAGRSRRDAQACRSDAQCAWQEGRCMSAAGWTGIIQTPSSRTGPCMFALVYRCQLRHGTGRPQQSSASTRQTSFVCSGTCTKAPQMAPSSCDAAYSPPRFQEQCPVRHCAKVTAGLRCPPLTCAVAYTSTTCAAALIASVLSSPCHEAELPLST